MIELVYPQAFKAWYDKYGMKATSKEAHDAFIELVKDLEERDRKIADLAESSIKRIDRVLGNPTS